VQQATSPLPRVPRRPVAMTGHAQHLRLHVGLDGPAEGLQRQHDEGVLDLRAVRSRVSAQASSAWRGFLRRGGTSVKLR
jgi:hypothetical protein